MGTICKILPLSVYIGESISSENLESLIKLCIHDELLDNKYLEKLNYLFKCPNLTAYDIWKCVKDIKINDKKPDRSSIRRDCKHLLELGLIEIAKESIGPKEEDKVRLPYRLSLNGIFYSILNNVDGFYDEITISLIKNYGSNILFTLFLY